MCDINNSTEYISTPTYGNILYTGNSSAVPSNEETEILIAIVNQQVQNDKGETKYAVKINHLEIATFYHRPENGVTVCLQLASEAAAIAFSPEHIDETATKITPVLRLPDNFLSNEP